MVLALLFREQFLFVPGFPHSEHVGAFRVGSVEDDGDAFLVVREMRVGRDLRVEEGGEGDVLRGVFLTLVLRVEEGFGVAVLRDL